MADAVAKMSKSQLEKKVRNQRMSVKRAAEEGKRIGSNVGLVSIAGLSAFGSGMLYEKFGNNITYFGDSDVRTDLVFGSGLTLLGIFSRGAMSGGSLALGLGLLLPWAQDQGRVVAQKMG